uniref:Putative bace-2 ixodes scapularis bace-2 n=1 Tax=Amblyomma triste TaxID=251400 RepID=A0A023G6B9_AMBTT
MEALRFQKGITHYIVSFCEQNATDSAQSSGVLSFNGKVLEGTIFTSVYIPAYFSVYVTSIKLGAREWPGSCSELNEKPVIVDYGTTDLKVPQVVFDWMFDALCEQAAYNFSREDNAVYCLEDGLLRADLPTLELFYQTHMARFSV